MSDGHLYLSARGGADYAGDSRHAWYDATHQSVLLLSPSLQLQQLPLDASLDPVEASTAAVSSSAAPLYNFTEPETSDNHRNTAPQRSLTPIVLLQLSVDRQFLAIQRSDIEVQVVHLPSRASYWVLCKSKAGNRILHGGVVWNTHSVKASSSQDLFLITKLGLEHHRVSSKRRSCTLHRTVGLYVHEFWYASSHGVLLVSSGSRANEIAPFLLHGPNAEKLPKLVFSTSVSKQDLHLVSLYGEMYAVYSDTRSTKLLLYLIGRTKVTCVRSLNVMLPSGTALEYSVVDNLLVCHSLDFNVSLFFDIKCDGNISDPFSAPLPISARPPGPPPAENASSAEAVSSKATGDTEDKFDSDVVEVIGDENDQHMFNESAWGLPQSTLGIRRALSVDDLDVHPYIDDASLPSPPFKISPASHLARRRSTRRLQRAMSAASLKKTETSKHEIVAPSFARWRFHAPNLVQRSFSVNGREQVEIRKLQVNLTEICKTCEHHREILSFLLRRGDHEKAKLLVLKLVRSHIVEQQASLSSIVQLLVTVQTVYGSERQNKNIAGSELSERANTVQSGHATNPGQRAAESSVEHFKANPPARNARGFLLIEQAEFYRYVWSETLQDANIVKSCNLSVYIIEYIKNLRENKVPVEDITYVALAKCFTAAGEPGKLYQFLHYHVLADSLTLADLMVRNGVKYPALMQVGLDMYFRLREICPLVRTLLDLGQTERAIEVAWRNMGLTSCDASVLPGVVFFDSLVKSVILSEKPRSPLQVTQMLGNLLLFLNVWDPAALQCSGTTSLSTLASCATAAFPDDLISTSSRTKLRAAFGFAAE
ncbi:Regulator of MON1-CCZ1 complex-like protein [Phytophthora ramorum]|uniref:Regulator of MON1-CCZ1 complex-like protein n=1 Tax=Phytophthora ramorum TaxID=164328 RepID=UPI00309C43FF|nr:Regulator of MON1-CCZ1 complex-like protein [Phytophthora ramorum]